MSRRRRWRAAPALVLGLAVAAFSATACRRGETTKGQLCRELGRATCVDSAHVLVCRGYAWHLDPCRGPDGCTGIKDHAQCDSTLADEKDGCGERGKTSCTRDKRALLECNGSSFVLTSTCLGPEGCIPERKANNTRCDARLAREGDPCTRGDRGGAKVVITARDHAYVRGSSHNGRPPLHDAVACTPEHDAELVCQNGVFVRFKSCRGADGCTPFDDDEVVCDDSVAEPGDQCHGGLHQVCGRDGRTVLQCADCMNGRYVAASTCGGPGGCVARREGGDTVDCDDSIAEPGETCTRHGSFACTHDGKKMLRCRRSSTMVADASGARRLITSAGLPIFSEVQRCPRGCRVTRTSDGSRSEVSVQCK